MNLYGFVYNDGLNMWDTLGMIPLRGYVVSVQKATPPLWPGLVGFGGGEEGGGEPQAAVLFQRPGLALARRAGVRWATSSTVGSPGGNSVSTFLK